MNQLHATTKLALTQAYHERLQIRKLEVKLKIEPLMPLDCCYNYFDFEQAEDAQIDKNNNYLDVM